jgi:hypothetical protein
LGTPLEPVKPLENGIERPVGSRLSDPDERHLHDNARIRLAGQLGKRLPEHVERPRQPRRPESRPHPRRSLALGGRQMLLPRAHQRHECITQRRDEILAQRPRIPPRRERIGHRDQHPPGIPVAHGVEHRVHGLRLVDDLPERGHLVERRQRVPRRALAPPNDEVDGRLDLVGRNAQPCVRDDAAHVVSQQIRRQQVEVEVLSTAPNGGPDFLRIGGRQHEHNV